MTTAYITDDLDMIMVDAATDAADALFDADRFYADSRYQQAYLAELLAMAQELKQIRETESAKMNAFIDDEVF